MALKTGLKEGEVRLACPSSTWARRFQRERAELCSELGVDPSAVEHIGSTAIPGLPAKPILDLAVQMPGLKALPQFRKKLRHMGYVYKGVFGLRGRHFFTKGNPVVVHLHLVSRRSVHWIRWRRFRNALLADPALVRRYGRLKKQLARRYANDRPGYTRAKSEFIQQVLDRAAAGRAGR